MRERAVDIPGNTAAVNGLSSTSRPQGRQALIFIPSGGTILKKAGSLPFSGPCPANPITPHGITTLTPKRHAYRYPLRHRTRGARCG